MWPGLIGVDFFLGLLGCLLLLWLAKVPINRLVERKENYYERGGDSHD